MIFQGTIIQLQFDHIEPVISHQLFHAELEIAKYFNLDK